MKNENPLIAPRVSPHLSSKTPDVLDRPDVPGGFWNRGWPVLAVGIMFLVAIRACVPGSTQPFDVDNAMKSAHEKTLAALRGTTDAATAARGLHGATVYFAAGSATLTPEAQQLLAAAIPTIRRLPANATIEIAGHSDDREMPATDVGLSQARADAVQAALVQGGVSVSRLLARGYGASKPVAANASDEGRFRNRRVALTVTQPQSK